MKWIQKKNGRKYRHAFFIIRYKDFFYDCECGREWHIEDAVYCSGCGRQIDLNRTAPIRIVRKLKKRDL